jgi:DNA uptake protein ComE-like DNA-binding protein
MRHSFLSMLIFLATTAAKAQEQKSNDTMKASDNVQWEKIFESETEDEENTYSIDELEQFEDNPLDLNTASLEELHCIPAMTNLAASRIIARREYALFTSLNELANIDGISQEMLSFIRLFARVKKTKEKSNLKGIFLNRTSAEIEKRKGYLNNAYYDSPMRILNKFHISIGNEEAHLTSVISKVDIGILTEKDPGERSLKDYSSCYGCISIPGLSSQLIIGNYQIEAAEGLIFWRSSAFLKGSDVIAPARKNGRGLHPYVSTNENSFFQGVAFSMDLNLLQLHLFYSDRPVNAAIDTLGQISSIDQTGLFRTENELRKKNSTRETIMGCRSTANIFEGLKLGGTAYRTQFKDLLILKNENDITTNKLWMHGIDVSYTNDKIDLFTEIAVDRSDKAAIIGGLIYEPTTSLSISLVARNYPFGFQSIHGNAFGETGRQVQNENGVYIGIRTHLIDWLWISTYYDQFNHPQSTKFIPIPSHGNDFLALAEIAPANECNFTIRFKRKELLTAIDENDLYGRMTKKVSTRVQENYRFTNEIILSSPVSLLNRIEWIKVMYTGVNKWEQGLLISHTVKFTVLHSLTVRARVAIFETDSYDSKIYEYEDDLTRVSLNPALYGRGLRWYLTNRCNVFKNVDISIKYSQTIKDGVKSIGSGLDEIEGNTQSLLSLQVYVRF